MLRSQTRAKKICSDTNQLFTKFQRLRQQREVPLPEPTAEVYAKKAANTLTIPKDNVCLQISFITFLSSENRQISKIVAGGN